MNFQCLDIEKFKSILPKSMLLNLLLLEGAGIRTGRSEREAKAERANVDEFERARIQRCRGQGVFSRKRRRKYLSHFLENPTFFGFSFGKINSLVLTLLAKFMKKICNIILTVLKYNVGCRPAINQQFSPDKAPGGRTWEKRKS